MFDLEPPERGLRPDSVTPPERGASGWVGWLIFASFSMLVLGAFNVMAGLAALFGTGWFRTAAREVLPIDHTWGWFLVVFGTVVIVAGFAVLAGQTWARVVGVVLAVLNGLSQLVAITAYPVWSIVVLVLDGIVIYALVAHGRELA